MHPTPNEIVVFTDGASHGNPGPGGFGAVIVASCQLSSVGKERTDQMCIAEIGGREPHTTNNRMELQAAVSALSFLGKLKAKSYLPAKASAQAGKLTAYSDSSYLINGITKWIFGWQKNGWRTKDRKSVLNADLWRALFELTEGKKIDWRLVGGHIGIAGNTRSDEIATAFAGGKNPKLYKGPLAGYPVKHILDIKHDAGLIQQKSESRTHSKAKAHSYVSMVNGVIQTHKTWAECEERVKGKKAKYQKALSADEEQKLIAEWSKQH